PRRLTSDGYGRRGNHGKHNQYDQQGRTEHSRDQPLHKRKSKSTSSLEASSMISPDSSVTRRSVYLTKGYSNHRISINPVTAYLSDTDHHHGLAARGLLDPIIPIVGLIPGLEGVVKLVPELLNGLLGPALGGLVISPNAPSDQALAASNGNDTLENESQYILAATQANASTIWLVDTGHPAPPDTESALASNSTVAPTNERMVSLQMAFVDAKTGEFEPYCATYERDPAKPVSLGVIPCKDKNPKDSQLFAYNPETSVLRAIWESVDAESLALGGGMRRRQYMVGGGTNVTAEGAESMVVMVFQPANVDAPVESPGVTSTQNVQAFENGSVEDVDNSTTSATNSDDLSASGEGPHNDTSSSVIEAPAHLDHEKHSTENPSDDEESDDDDNLDDDSSESSTNNAMSAEPNSPLNPSADKMDGLSDGAVTQSSLPSQTVVSAGAAATPVLVQHLDDNSPSGTTTARMVRFK
ncbi:hypothetical protein FRC07_011329, partial [Ceratobasidium sp. 392]